MTQPLPPVPPVGKEGLQDPVWARWLGLLRNNIVQAITSVAINTANGFSGSVSVSGGVSTITIGVTVSGLLKGSAGGIVAATAGTDYVQSVSVTAPVTNSGTAANPNIGMPVATSSANGYLSSGDWSTFNSKLSANQTITLSGDASGSGATAITVTLATVNGSPGTFGSGALIPVVTVNGKGLVTSVTTTTNTPAFSAITGKPTTATGYGIVSIDNIPIGATTTANGNFSVLLANSNSSVEASTTNALSIPNNAFTTVTTFIASRNVGGNFTASTGVYVAPLAGFYDVRAAFRLAASVGAVNAQFLVAVFVNGTNVHQSGVTYITASATPMQGQLSCMLKLATSDSVTIRIFQNSGAAIAMDGVAVANWLMIQQLPSV